jgi:hypothetical protein
MDTANFKRKKSWRCRTIKNRSQLYKFCLAVPITQRNGHYQFTKKYIYQKRGDMFKSFRHLPLRNMQTLATKLSARVSNRTHLLPYWKRKTAQLNHNANPSNRFRCAKLKTEDFGGPNDGFFRRLIGKVPISCFFKWLNVLVQAGAGTAKNMDRANLNCT